MQSQVAPRSYVVATEHGATWRRNRQDLRADHNVPSLQNRPVRQSPVQLDQPQQQPLQAVSVPGPPCSDSPPRLIHSELDQEPPEPEMEPSQVELTSEYEAAAPSPTTSVIRKRGSRKGT